MATLNYSLPGVELELQDGGLSSSTAEEQTVLVIGPTENKTSNKRVLDPIVVKGKSSFGKDSELGEYVTNNAIARGYKQVNDIRAGGIAAIPLPADSVIFGDEKEKTDNKKLKAWILLHDIMGSLKNNSVYDAVIFKNMYPEDYKIENVPVVAINYLKAVIDGTATKKLTTWQDKSGAAIIKDGSVICVAPDATIETTEVKKVEYITITEEVGEDPKKTTKVTNILPFSFVTLKVTGDTVTIDTDKCYIPEVNDDPFYSEHVSGELIGTVQTSESLIVKTFDLAELVAGFCFITSITNKQILGFMSIKPPMENDIVSIKKWVEAAPTAIYNGYLQLIAAPSAAFGFEATGYTDTVEAAYCGLVQSLNSESSTTNKAIPGIRAFDATLSSSQCSALSLKNYVTLRKRKGVYVVCDGITTAGADSDYTRLTTIRITNEVVESVRDVGDPYIGEPNTTASRNALQAQIKEMLAQMQAAGKISGFIDPELVCSTQDIIDGNLKILIAFFPVFELRRINLVIALRQIQ